MTSLVFLMSVFSQMSKCQKIIIVIMCNISAGHAVSVGPKAYASCKARLLYFLVKVIEIKGDFL